LIHVAACGVLLAVVSMDALPADGASYQRPKGGDYRGGVDRVLSADGERPVVLVVGPYPGWIVSGLGYYASVRGSHLAVFDALRPSDSDLAELKAATSLWVAGYSDPSPPATDPPGPPRESYIDFWLLPSSGSVASRADAVLGWVQKFEPAIAGTRQLVALTLGEITPGPEILPAPTQSSAETGAPFPDRWTVQPDVATSGDGKGFVLHPHGDAINAIYTTASLVAGHSYLLTVGCDPHALAGLLQVFVVLRWSGGTITLPDEAGYYCSGGSPPSNVYLPFRVEAPATSVTVYLRGSGSGTGSFSDPSLRSIG
jgi:hypothetical protein